MSNANPRFFASLIICFSFLSVDQSYAGTSLEASALLAKYEKIRKTHKEIAPGLPIYIRTQSQGKTLIVESFGLIHHPFHEVASVLSRHQSYCEFLPLLFNSKACLFRQDGSTIRIKHFVAGKHYTHPVASIRIHSVFKLLDKKSDYVSVRMSSDPVRPRANDYRVNIKVIPIGNESLLSVQSVYIPGPVTRAATNTYVRIFARNKPGFTVVGSKKNGKPKYIGGFPAVIERSVVRAYLALKAYMKTYKLPKAKQFESRIAVWYKLNGLYKDQLYELEKSEYFDIQRRERINQKRYQINYAKPGKNSN